MWLRILALAGCYYIAGQLGLLLAIPPGYAATFWPAAGIALAGLLLLGPNAWPGVMLGSYLLNLTINLDSGNVGALMVSLMLPLGIGCGAAAQAVVGAALIRRFVGFPNDLNHDQDIAKLLILAGPVSSIINASTGMLVLWLSGRIQASECAFSWWVWYVGDSIGALVVTPMILLWARRTQSDWPRRPLTVTVPLVVLATLVVMLFVYTDGRERERMRSAFEFQTESLARALESRLDRIMESHYGMRAFQPDLDMRTERSRFAELAEVTMKRRASINALVWAPRVSGDDRARYEKVAKSEIHSDFRMREFGPQRALISASDRAEYYPILYRLPAPPSPDYFGFDVGCEPLRLEAMAKAAATGESVASRSVPGPPQAASDDKYILLFLALYQGGIPPRDPEERRKAVLGYMVVVLHTRNLVENAWQSMQSDGINFWLFDDALEKDKQLALYRRDGHGTERPPDEAPRIQSTTQTREIVISGGNRPWRLRFAQTLEYASANRSLQAWTVLAGGMLLTGLVGGVLLVVTGRAALVAAMVDERTNELAQANSAMTQEIGERKRIEDFLRVREDLLRQSEERFRVLVEGTSDFAIFMLDPAGNVATWNTGAKRLTGYSADEIIGVHHSRFYPPEDQEKVERLRAVTESKGRCEAEGWRVRKDGSRFWAQTVLTAIRDERGTLKGYLKVTRDITQRREIDAALEKSRRFVERIAEMVPSILFVDDLREERKVFANRRVETMLGLPADDPHRQWTAVLIENCHPDDLPKLEWASERYQTADDGEVIELDFRVHHADGSWRWLRTRNTVFMRDADGTPIQILGTIQDITERKRLEHEVLEIATSEQRRIGQELHDGSGQELTGLCMLAANLAESIHDVTPKDEALARRIADGLRQALTHVRELSRGLVPVEVDAEGLMAALAELARRISELQGVNCVFDCSEPVPVEDNYTATQLYRIAQEAITNAIKHGKSSNIRVSLEAKGYYLTLKVADDGVGLPDGENVTEGTGLRIMRYRAGQIGGQFSVRPGPQRGAVVACTVFRSISS